jgi:cell division protease FtsH
MVGRCGMSDVIGPIAVLGSDGPEHWLAAGISDTSEATRKLLDEEVRRLVDDAHDAVAEMLTEHRGQLENLTHALLEAETLDAIDAYGAAGLPSRSQVAVC